MAPPRLDYVSSWVETNYARSFQVMHTSRRRASWTTGWPTGATWSISTNPRCWHRPMPRRRSVRGC